MFDFSPYSGDPDLASSAFGPAPLCSTSPSASYTPTGGSAVTAGLWSVVPSECGPYASTAPAGTVSVGMTAVTRQFDSQVTSSTGDLWLTSVNPSTTFSPVVINPGQTATINVTITPSGAAGTVVQGELYVDDFVAPVPPYGQQTGDELAGFPYEYTIG